MEKDKKQVGFGSVPRKEELSEGKLTIEQAMIIILELAVDNMYGEDNPDPELAAVGKRQHKALKKFEKFLKRALAADKERKKLKEAKRQK